MAFDRLSAMRIFAAVVHAGSFVGGAKRMRLSTSAVSRKVAELEEILGVRLLQRTTRRLRLTDAGRNYFEGCERILAALDDVESRVLAEGNAPGGRLRIATQLSISPLLDTLVQFCREYPGVDVEFMRVMRPVDMLEEQFDVWIHVFGPIPSEHVARPLMPLQPIVAASPEYLERAGTPTHPRQLAKHACLTSNLGRDSNPWQFERSGEVTRLRMPGHFVTNDMEALIRMARAGMGIIRIPRAFLADDLRQGRLRQVLSSWSTLSSLRVSAVYPSARHLPLKVRTFVDFLAQRFAAASW